MSTYLYLPIRFLQFWFFEAPKSLFFYFLAFNRGFVHILSLPLFLRTFFRPLKNEYRSGLVGFSVGMGIAVKSFLILFDLAFLSVLLLIELILICAFILVPIGTVYLIFL